MTEIEERTLRVENETLKRLLTSANEELARFYKIAPMVPLIEALGDFLEQVATEQKPLLTNICGRTTDGEEVPLISLWAAFGEHNPIDRIEELSREIAALKEQLSPPASPVGER